MSSSRRRCWTLGELLLTTLLLLDSGFVSLAHESFSQTEANPLCDVGESRNCLISKGDFRDSLHERALMTPRVGCVRDVDALRVITLLKAIIFMRKRQRRREFVVFVT